MAGVCGVTLLLTFFLSKPSRAYQLGEVYAQNMGVPLRAFRTALILSLIHISLFGARPPKGQEMDDHYFGAIKPRVAEYMACLLYTSIYFAG